METRFAQFERILGRIFLSLVSIAISIALLEIGYRILAPPAGPTQGATWLINDSNQFQKPYVMYTAEPDQNLINALGYLGPLPSKIKPKDEYRIFILGGSAVFYEKPNFVDFLFQQLPANVKIFNMGIPSSVARQELIRVLLDVSSYEPDLVISFSGYNDLYDTGWDQRINYPHRYVLFETNPFIASVENYNWLGAILMGSKIVRDHFSVQLFSVLVSDIYPQNLPKRDSIRSLIVASYFQNLRLTNRLSHSLGSRFLAYQQPVLYFKECYTPQEQKYVDAFLPLQNAFEIQKLVKLEHEKFSTEFKFKDLSDIFKGVCEPRFKDYVHYDGEEAQKEIAERILPDVLAEISKGPSAKPRMKLVHEHEFLQ